MPHTESQDSAVKKQGNGNVHYYGCLSIAYPSQYNILQNLYKKDNVYYSMTKKNKKQDKLIIDL